MKKFWAMALCLAALKAAAEDSYLYWMMDAASAQEYEYDRVRIRVDGTGGDESVYMNLYSGDSGLTVSYGQDVGRTIAETAASKQTGMWASIASAYVGNSYSYIIELINSESVNTAYALINPATIELVQAGNLTGAKLAMGGAFASPVPEPSTAFLLTIGCALLCLRRRRTTNRENVQKVILR